MDEGMDGGGVGGRRRVRRKDADLKLHWAELDFRNKATQYAKLLVCALADVWVSVL